MLVNRLPGPATITSARRERVARLGQEARPLRNQRDARDPPARRRDRGFAAQHAAVLELRDERDDLARRRQHRAVRADHARRDFHRAREVVRDVGERRQARGCRSRGRSSPSPDAEAVLEDVGDERVVVRERRQAVADVARRDDVEFRAQLSRAPAVVGGRDDGDEPIARRDLAAAARRRRRAAAAGRAARSADRCRRRCATMRGSVSCCGAGSGDASPSVRAGISRLLMKRQRGARRPSARARARPRRSARAAPAFAEAVPCRDVEWPCAVESRGSTSRTARW